MPRYYIEKKYEKSKVIEVVLEVEDSNYSLDVCIKACKILSTLSALALQSRNNEILVDFLDDGACEMLLMLLNKFSMQSSEICTYVCQIICNLCYYSIELREFLGEIDACSLVVFATSLHIGDSGVSEYGSLAMYLLGHNNITNSLKLAESNACEVLTQTGNFGFNVSNERSSYIATYVCLALSLLCEANNSSTLIDCGVDELVISLMKVHLENKKFTSAGIRLICSLASLNPEHRQLLGKLEACQLILDVITKNDRTTFLQDCCETIMHLSSDNKMNCLKLSQMDACGKILVCLDNQLYNHEFGAEVCSGGVRNLLTYGGQSVYNDTIKKLKQYNAIDIFHKTQINSKTSYRAKENINHIIECLNSISSPVIASTKKTASLHKMIDNYNNNTTHSDTAVVTTEETSDEDLSHDEPVIQLVQPLSAETREYIEFRKLTTSSLENESDDDDPSNLMKTHASKTKSGVYEI